MPEKQCVTGVHPDTPFTIPGDSQFEFGSDFMPAERIRVIGDALIRSAEHGLGAILEHEATVSYLWVKALKKSAGNVVLAKCFRESGRSGFYSQSDYSIEFYTGSLMVYQFNCWQMEALVHHELSHILIEDDEENGLSFKIKGHDVEMFYTDIERYGLWKHDLVRASRTFAQTSLFDTPEATREFNRVFENLTSEGSSVSINGVEIESAEQLKKGMERIVDDALKPRPGSPRVNPDTGEILNSLPTVDTVTATLTDDERAQAQANAELREAAWSDESDRPLALLTDDAHPEEIAALSTRMGLPTKWDPTAQVYRNPQGDAYADGIVEREFVGTSRRIGFQTN